MMDVVPLFAGTEGSWVGRVERPTSQIAQPKIRIGQERHAERDEIGFPVGSQNAPLTCHGALSR